MLRVGHGIWKDASCPLARDSNDFGIGASLIRPAMALYAIVPSKRLLAYRTIKGHLEVRHDVSRDAAVFKLVGAARPLALRHVLCLSIHAMMDAEMCAYLLGISLDPFTTGISSFVPLALVHDDRLVRI